MAIVTTATHTAGVGVVRMTLPELYSALSSTFQRLLAGSVRFQHASQDLNVVGDEAGRQPQTLHPKPPSHYNKPPTLNPTFFHCSAARHATFQLFACRRQPGAVGGRSPNG